MSEAFDFFNVPSDLIQELLDRRDAAFSKARHIVRPLFPSQERFHRVSWERLQEHIALDEKRTIERLCSAPEGERVAERFAELPTHCPVDEFCQGMLTLLDELAMEYDRANGFDLDIFFLARDLDDTSTWSVWFEVFPRPVCGRMVTAEASLMAQQIPFLIFESRREIDEEGVIGLFLAEKVFGGQEIADVIRELMSRRDWFISLPDVWDILLNRMCLSIVWSGGREGKIAVPRTDHDLTGAARRASLHVIST